MNAFSARFALHDRADGASARQGSAQDRIDWLRAEQARAGNAYERALLEDLLYRMEKWGMANAEQMARRNDVAATTLVEESR